jgi:hypothetical protein
MSHDERKGLGVNLFFWVDFMKDTYKKGFARLVTVIILCQLDDKMILSLQYHPITDILSAFFLFYYFF